MTLTEVVEKGLISFKKENSEYVVVYSGYKEYGFITKHEFKARNLKLAYMKLEEYLKYSN